MITSTGGSRSGLGNLKVVGSNTTVTNQKNKKIIELGVGINLILHKYRIGLKF